MIGIYKITNLITNNVYIGQSIHIEDRWEQHKREARGNKTHTKLYIAMRQYGIENFSFEVIEECTLDEEVLNTREKYWIQYYDSFYNGYNMTSGGQGNAGWIFDPEKITALWDAGYSTQQIADELGCCIQLINSRLKNYKDFSRASSHRRAYTAKYLDTPTPYIYQYTLLGKYIRQYTSIREAEKELGVPHSNCISKCIQGKTKTAYGYQWKNYKQDIIAPTSSAHSKLVKCIETDELFPNSNEAALKYHLASRHNIIRACNNGTSAGKHPITGEKLHWKYVEENNNAPN